MPSPARFVVTGTALAVALCAGCSATPDENPQSALADPTASVTQQAPDAAAGGASSSQSPSAGSSKPAATPSGSASKAPVAAPTTSVPLPSIPSTGEGKTTSQVKFSTSDKSISAQGDSLSMCLVTGDSLDASFESGGLAIRVSATEGTKGSLTVSGDQRLTGVVTALKTTPAGEFTATGHNDDKSVTFTLSGKCPKLRR